MEDRIQSLLFTLSPVYVKDFKGRGFGFFKLIKFTYLKTKF